MSAELPRLDVVFVSELVYSTGLHVNTILRRIHLSDTNPDDPRAIPYLKHLGKPYRVTRETAKRLLSETGSVAA